MNQGIFSFYRGQSSLMLILATTQAFRFAIYDQIVEQISSKNEDQNLSLMQKSLVASSISSVLLTTILYPLDLCHTRMSADMTKKQSLYNQSHKSKSQSKPVTNYKNQINQAKLYSNVLDCLKKS